MWPHLCAMQVGSIVNGKVVRLGPYGAFVEISGGVRGLLHMSKVSRERVESMESVLAMGEVIKVCVHGCGSHLAPSIMQASVVVQL